MIHRVDCQTQACRFAETQGVVEIEFDHDAGMYLAPNGCNPRCYTCGHTFDDPEEIAELAEEIEHRAPFTAWDAAVGRADAAHSSLEAL